jgi:nucleotide-binding universal stress UspA family protein
MGDAISPACDRGRRCPCDDGLIEGTPAREITRFAKKKHADLLIIGTHGRTGLARLFLGSVANQIVATAPCPVMTVR